MIKDGIEVVGQSFVVTNVTNKLLIPTGTLRFGKIDVTEAQYGIMGLHLLTFIFGSNMWQQNVSIF